MTPRTSAPLKMPDGGVVSATPEQICEIFQTVKLPDAFRDALHTVAPDDVRTVVTRDNWMGSAYSVGTYTDRMARESIQTVALTPDLLRRMGEQARASWRKFDTVAQKIMSVQRYADAVRTLRVVEHRTWRSVAWSAHLVGMGAWMPFDNQLLGMALCEHAAPRFGEYYLSHPWN